MCETEGREWAVFENLHIKRAVRNIQKMIVNNDTRGC